MDKEDVVYTYTMENYSVTKKNETMPFTATWMDLEIIILSASILERGRQIPHHITYTWNLKYDKNEHIYETDIENRLAVAKREEVGKKRIQSLRLVDAN